LEKEKAVSKHNLAHQREREARVVTLGGTKYRWELINSTVNKTHFIMLNQVILIKFIYIPKLQQSMSSSQYWNVLQAQVAAVCLQSNLMSLFLQQIRHYYYRDIIILNTICTLI
jgi:hypothetical protein